ncbi:Galactokinase [Melipona quadrifasciata]|uniref:Galactokinase n=1 Tax=Melipona quadrifasciata TaxID=166423 RepID=A0A0M8ZUI5_9HYME|nr:Galactokinase [Melipona quadrifasciata]
MVAQVPGFKVVIVSSLPAKLGLGSNSALVVALYMFLEAITNTCTGNVMEKMFACQLAERLATNSCKVRASDVLVSIIGEEGRIFAFDARSLDVDRLNWNVDMDVQLVLVELISNDFEKGRSSAQRASKTRCERVATAMNTTSRWRAHPAGVHNVYVCIAGELLRENHRSVCKRLNFSPDDTKRIENMFEPTEGVLGVSVVNYGTSVVTLVRKSKLKTFISLSSRAGIPRQRYYLIKACTGASTIYAYERIARIKYPSHPRLIVKHHLREKIDTEETNVRKYDVPLYVHTISLFVSRKSSKS